LKARGVGTTGRRLKKIAMPEELTMLDTIVAEIRGLISAGATQTEWIAVVAYLADLYPDLTSAELSTAMQQAMAEAELQASRRH
jgi:hypothetical protein